MMKKWLLKTITIVVACSIFFGTSISIFAEEIDPSLVENVETQVEDESEIEIEQPDTTDAFVIDEDSLIETEKQTKIETEEKGKVKIDEEVSEEKVENSIEESESMIEVAANNVTVKAQEEKKITIGTKYTLNLSKGNDIKEYSLNTEDVPKAYQFSVVNPEHSSSCLKVAVLDSDGAPVFESTLSCYYDHEMSFTIKTRRNSKYTLRIYRNNTVKNGNCFFKVLSLDDEADSFEKTKSETVNYGENKFGTRYTRELLTINNSPEYDQDYYKIITANYPAEYTFSVKNIDVDNGMELIVYEKDGTKVSKISADKAVEKQVTLKLKKNRTYYLCFDTVRHRSSGKYKFSIKCKSDVPDTKNKATTIKTGKLYKNVLGAANDKDWFKFTAKRNGNYNFQLNNISVNNLWRCSYSLSMQIYSGSKMIGGISSWTGSGSTTIKLAKGKTYFIKISSTAGNIGNYQFKVS